MGDGRRLVLAMVKDARQVDLTSAQPDEMARQMAESWPFHPSLRDLYTRFRENKGFQQTREIRLKELAAFLKNSFEPTSV